MCAPRTTDQNVCAPLYESPHKWTPLFWSEQALQTLEYRVQRKPLNLRYFASDIKAPTRLEALVHKPFWNLATTPPARASRRGIFPYAQGIFPYAQGIFRYAQGIFHYAQGISRYAPLSCLFHANALLQYSIFEKTAKSGSFRLVSGVLRVLQSGYPEHLVSGVLRVLQITTIQPPRALFEITKNLSRCHSRAFCPI